MLCKEVKLYTYTHTHSYAYVCVYICIYLEFCEIKIVQKYRTKSVFWLESCSQSKNRVLVEVSITVKTTVLVEL